ncbi:MAG: adaptor protein MecA [Lachnospiraceae bacterium]|nr:adaptor protein MecA [Lachnospiraceae bacterium]
MKYRRIDQDTIQCIVTGDDMNERGLTMGDIFERSERAEGFLRELIEEAHEEVGYDLTGPSIAMQITPVQDDGMIITITNERSTGLLSFLEHMRDVMAALAGGQLTGEEHNFLGTDPAEVQKYYEEAPEADDQPEDVRVFEFASMSDVLEFAADGFAAAQVKSVLGFADDKYYLVVTKNRCSWKNFNKLSAKAFDYANVITDIRGKLIYLSEHGEGIIESGALTALKRIAQGK